MAYTVKQLGNEPIIVLTATNPWDPIAEFGPMLAEVGALADRIAAPVVWRLADVRELDITFDALVDALMMDSRGGPGSAADPRIKPVWVGSNQLASVGVEAFKQPQYGAVNAQLFSTVEDALAYIRNQR